LRPVDYYQGNPKALLAERKRKLREAAARRREVNRCGNLTKIGGGQIYITNKKASPNPERLLGERKSLLLTYEL